MNELKEEIGDLMTQLAHANDEVDVLQEELDDLKKTHDDDVKEAYDEGYADAIENAKLAIERLQ